MIHILCWWYGDDDQRCLRDSFDPASVPKHQKTLSTLRFTSPSFTLFTFAHFSFLPSCSSNCTATAAATKFVSLSLSVRNGIIMKKRKNKMLAALSSEKDSQRSRSKSSKILLVQKSKKHCLPFFLAPLIPLFQKMSTLTTTMSSVAVAFFAIVFAKAFSFLHEKKTD